MPVVGSGRTLEELQLLKVCRPDPIWPVARLDGNTDIPMSSRQMYSIAKLAAATDSTLTIDWTDMDTKLASFMIYGLRQRLTVQRSHPVYGHKKVQRFEK